MTTKKTAPKDDDKPQDVSDLQQALTTRSDFTLVPKTMTEALEFANMIAKSDAVTEHYHNKAANVFVAVMYGLELGLTPMTTLQNSYVVNGKVSLYGEIGLGMILAHPDFIDFTETVDDKSATCSMQRKFKQTGKIKTVEHTYTMVMATRAKLDKKEVWSHYRERMLQFRARWWVAKDLWADVLKGIGIVDRETGDYLEGEAERVPTFEMMSKAIDKTDTAESWATMRDYLSKYQGEFTETQYAELANKLNALKTQIGVVTRVDETKAALDKQIAEQTGQEGAPN